MSSAALPASVGSPQPAGEHAASPQLPTAADGFVPDGGGDNDVVFTIGGHILQPGRPKRRKIERATPRVLAPKMTGQLVPPPPPPPSQWQPLREAVPRPPPMPFYQGAPSSNPIFTWKGRPIILTGVNNINAVGSFRGFRAFLERVWRKRDECLIPGSGLLFPALLSVSGNR